MSSFSDKLAMFQKSSNKINNNNKKNENDNNKNKINDNYHIDKGKNKEKEKNKEITLQNNIKKKNNIPINDIIEKSNDKKEIENNKNNFNDQNNMKKNLILFENREKNNKLKDNINRDMIEALKEKLSKKNQININNDKNEMVHNINSEKEKKAINKTENINKNLNNQSNNLKNRLNIFESKVKNNEKKEIREKQDKMIANNNSLNKKSNEENKFNSNSIINNINNKNNNEQINRKTQTIKDKPAYIKNIILNKDNENKKKLEENGDKDITRRITYINNKFSIKSNNINNTKNEKSEIIIDNIKKNNDNISKTEPNYIIIPNDNNERKQSKINITKEKESSINTNNDIILTKKFIPESIMNETFCMAFFITSFNFKQPKIIEKSDELVADCGHTFCSSLPAIVPEIFARYPQNDTKDFEISDLGASICFPNGIKLCFDKNEMHIIGLKNYSSVLTNQIGKRYFISTYHLYFKYSYDEFMNEYEYGNLIDKTLLQAIRVQYVYIPFCISLLSKYPFFNQMEKCLESFRFTILNNNINPTEMYDLLLYLTKSIPVPPIGTKLSFPLPYYPELITINQPLYKDIILFGDNPSIILEYLSVDEIIIILRLLLFEQKILLIGNNYDIISKIAFNFTNLLYPMQWVHTFIPIMTQKMMKYLDSFLPFFNGMHISLYELTSGILEDIKENIFIFDFNKHTFEMNTFPNLNTKNVIKKINELIPQFPKNILNNIHFGLTIIKPYLDKTLDINKNNMGVNIKIKQVFMQAFIEILSDYKIYLSLINEKPIFNSKAMLEKKPKADFKFYKEITETQLFQVFIQNNPVNTKANTFFEEQLDIYDNLKDKKEFKEEFINNYNITCEINENYFIPMEILDNFDINNQKKIKTQEEIKPEEYKKYLKKKYTKYDIYFKPKSILKFNKLIILNNLDFDPNKINKNIIYYLIPNLKFNFEVEKNRKTLRQKTIMMDKLKNNIREELTPEEKDEIRENITDVITKIFKNDEITDIEESKNLVLDSINNDYGRDLYINSLYNNKSILYKESFEFLEQLIFDSINKIINAKITKEKQMFYLLRLIKCCDNFKKEEKFLSDVLYPKLDKIKIINDFNFWKEYADLYIKDDLSKNMNKDDKWIECLEKIEKIMPMMGLKKTMIYSTLADIGKNNIEDAKFSELMKGITVRLKIFNL